MKPVYPKLIRLYHTFWCLLVLAGSFGAAKDKHMYVLYEKGSRIQEIALDGIRSKLGGVTPVTLGDEAVIKNCDSGNTSLVIAIGKPSLDKALESCKSTPVVFSLVSAPRFGTYKTHRNLTGVSFDLSFRLFLAEFQKILKPGSRIGFVYSSAVNEFLTTEIDYVESDFNFTGMRALVDNREQIGPKVKQLIEEEGVKAIWVLPDPLYNQAIFKKTFRCLRRKGSAAGDELRGFGDRSGRRDRFGAELFRYRRADCRNRAEDSRGHCAGRHCIPAPAPIGCVPKPQNF